MTDGCKHEVHCRANSVWVACNAKDSATMLQVFFPLAPGIESIWEPFQEEVEARVQEVQQQFGDVMDGTILPAVMCVAH